jgi:transcriptional regulator with XRE-family HTH domain
VDVCFVIQQRLKELGLEQRDLAAAAQVTESYISQLLTRKKAPPAADRTDLYDKMNAFLKLPKGQLSALVRAQRREELKKKLADSPAPLFKEVRDLILRKCAPGKQPLVRDIFEKQAFGELERLVTQKLLEVTKAVLRNELGNTEGWLRGLAKQHRRSYEQMRAMTLEFLNTDVFDLSMQHCSVFLKPVMESWDIDLKTFAMEIIPNKRLASTPAIKFEFVEMSASLPSEESPGFKEFMRNGAMSGDATEEELDFLKSLRFKQRRPSPLYFYRELQSLRDSLHFPEDSSSLMVKRRNFDDSDSLTPVETRKRALRGWVRNTPQNIAKTNPS